MPPQWPQTIRLRLFVAGGSLRRSRDAVPAAQDLVRWLSPQPCGLEVVDVLDNPTAAEAHGVVFTPALDRLAPAPQRRVLGDLPEPQQPSYQLALPNRPPR